MQADARRIVSSFAAALSASAGFPHFMGELFKS
jgi:hypothetical protein